MKKIKLIIGCLLLMTMGSSAAIADEAAPGFAPRIGVEGGFDLANLNGPNVNDVFGSRLGWVVGAFVNLPFGPTLALQPEILYEQKGGKFNGNPYQLDYVEVPILLDITLIGPLGILLGPSFDGNVASSGVQNVNNTDVGLVGGAQVFVGPLLFSGRYEIGLSNINSNQQIQNGTFTFMAGLSFI